MYCGGRTLSFSCMDNGRYLQKGKKIMNTCKECNSIYKSDCDFCSQECEDKHTALEIFNRSIKLTDTILALTNRISDLEKQVVELFQLNSNLRNRLELMDWEELPEEDNDFYSGNPACDPSCWE